MPAYIDQSFDEFLNQIHVGNLPPDVKAKEITDLFDQFGVIVKLHLKRRLSYNSPQPSRNPSVILIFQRRETVDRVMAERPFFLNDYQLFVRRCLPTTRRYPYEAQLVTNKILLRIRQDDHHGSLPKNNIVVEYLTGITDRITRLDRFDDKTMLIEFDDYDSVDVCCLSRPHLIDDQIVEIEKCPDEQRARRRALYCQRSRPITRKLSPTTTNLEVDMPSSHFISPTLTFSVEVQTAQLQLTYLNRTNLLEREHEQLVASLNNEWELIVKERLRLQRLTLDSEHERRRLIEENRRWKKLYNESLKEKPRIEQQGEWALTNAMTRRSKAERQYDQLIEGIHAQTT